MRQDTQPREGMAEVEWALEAARSGAATLRIGGQQIHSAYDPLREAATRAREIVEEMGSTVAQTLILVGIGLGYLVEELQQRFAGEILVWDPFPELTRSLRLDRRSQRPGVTVTSSYDALDAVLTPHLEGSRLRVFPHPGYSELARFELRWIQSSLRKNNPPFHPPDPAEAIVSPRALDALARLPELGNLIDLSGCLRGQTAILVAPGASLGDSLGALVERRGGALLAAVQAQRTLQEAGARVDFAVAPDPLHSLPFLEGFEPNFDALLAECSVEPALLDRWRSRTRIFPLVSNQLYDVNWRSLGLPPFDEPFNTVSETMLVLAHHLGARRFVFAGVDLSGPEKGQFAARSAAGQRVLTNPGYFHAARFLSHRCSQLAREGCEIWRVGDGLPILGAQTVSAAALPDRLAEAPSFEAAEIGGATAQQRDLRRAEVCAVLRAAAASKSRSTGGRAVGAIDAENRWSPYNPLSDDARAAALRKALAELEPSLGEGEPWSGTRESLASPRVGQQQHSKP